MARYANEMVAHIWAQNKPDEAGKSNNGQFYFEGRELYSYGSHFLVGFIMPDGTALLNPDRYSNTTNRHQSYAARAVKYAGHSVPDLTEMRYILRDLANGNPARAKELRPNMKAAILKRASGMSYEAIAYLLSLVGLKSVDAIKAEAAHNAMKERTQRAKTELANRIRTAENYLTINFNRVIQEGMNSYSDWQLKRLTLDLHRTIKATKDKIGVRKTAKLKDMLKTARAALHSYHDQQAMRQRNKNARNGIVLLRQLAKQYEAGTPWSAIEGHSARHYGNAARALLALPYVGPDLRAKLIALNNNAVERLAEIEREQQRVEFEREQDRRRAWLAGESVRSYGLSDERGNALMRIKGDVLQTSWGADVPLAHAIKVFRFVKLCRENGTPWQRNGKTIRVGHFTVDRIESNGDFKAGCHNFSWPEVERVARLAGVYEDAPSADVVEGSH